MMKTLAISFALAIATSVPASAQQINDAQIAHIAYTAGQIDIAAGKQALAKSNNAKIRMFAEQMVHDHTAVNDRAIALVKKLGVTPQDNPTSRSLSEAAAMKLRSYEALTGGAFDRAYIMNEVEYHKTVNGAVSGTLIPNAQNPELKALLEAGLKLFEEHQLHAEHVASMGR